MIKLKIQKLIATLREQYADAQLKAQGHVLVRWDSVLPVFDLAEELLASVLCDTKPVVSSETPKHPLQHDRALAEMTRLYLEAIRDRNRWKANHDNQVELKRAVLDRPDLAERAASTQALIAERDSLRQDHRRLHTEEGKAMAAMGWGCDDSRWIPGETAVDALIRENAGLEEVKRQRDQLLSDGNQLSVELKDVRQERNKIIELHRDSEAKRKKLAEFKQLSHNILDDAFVPGFQTSECRIKERLHWLIEQWQIKRNRAEPLTFVIHPPVNSSSGAADYNRDQEWINTINNAGHEVRHG